MIERMRMSPVMEYVASLRGERSDEDSSHERPIVPDRQLLELIQALLADREWRFEMELQQMVFLADVEAYTSRGEPLAGATFYPEIYGVHSSEVSEVLEAAAETRELQVKKGRLDNDVKPKYAIRGTIAVEPKILEVAQTVRDDTDGMGVFELVDRVKEDPIYEQAVFGEPIDIASAMDELSATQPSE